MKCGEEYWLEAPLADAFRAIGGVGEGCAVDIGANVGTWTNSLAERFECVIAIEPDQRAADKIPADDWENVEVIRKAVASHCNGVTFHFREESVYNSILDDHPIGGSGGKDVPCVDERKIDTITLDEIVRQRAIDFVKIDIEGGEVEALKGATRASDWAETVFLVECHDTYDQVAAELGRLGHEVERIPHPFGAHPGHCWAISHA